MCSTSIQIMQSHKKHESIRIRCIAYLSEKSTVSKIHNKNLCTESLIIGMYNIFSIIATK